MTVLITGANRGIGRALFDHYEGLGRPVIGTTRSDPPGPGWRQLDVTDPDSHARLREGLDGGPVELLVCNAGVYIDKGQNLADGFAPDFWAESFAVNVTGVFLTVQSLLTDLQTAPGAKVVIIASQMGSDTRASGGSYIYRASKAAAINLGRNLAADLRHLGIAVGIYHPGWVRTDMGGTRAEIGVEASARGLAARFEALSLDTTGCFETWDGRPHPF